MKEILVLLITAALYQNAFPRSSTPDTQSRIENLKGRLRAEIERKQGTNSASYDGDDSEQDSPHRDFWIQPIIPRERKRHRHKRPMSNITVKFPIKTRRKTTTCNGHKSKNQMRSELKAQRTTKNGMYMINPLDIFYRRVIEEKTGDMERKWAHCQDMITPYLTGVKKEPGVVKKVTARDPVALRLFQLLNINTTDYTKEDVFSVLFQISKLQIRLFQWDVMPIRILMNILIKERTVEMPRGGYLCCRVSVAYGLSGVMVTGHGQLHTFRNLKHGVKEMFARWRLTLDNTTNILRNTRIVRPPCTVTSRYSGSTKAQKVSKLKDWTAKSTTPCEYDDGVCDERK